MARMQIVFDRYEPLGGTRYVDLATRERVTIAIRAVPGRDWRRRWGMRVEALQQACDGIERLIDAGDAGAHEVFEVRALPAGGPAHVRALRVHHVARAIAWLSARRLTAGPCRRDRLLDDGRLRADLQTAWPAETAAEQRAARASWRAWRALAGAGPTAAATTGEPPRTAAVRYDATDEALDGRVGLIELPLPSAAALAFARATGRVALAGHVNPYLVPHEYRRRSFVLVDARRETCAAWSGALAASSGRRHFYVPAARAALVARERAPAYLPAPADVESRAAAGVDPRAREWLRRARLDLSHGRLAPAIRLAGRAVLVAAAHLEMRDEAAAIKIAALRLQGRAIDALALAAEHLRERDTAAPFALLLEAAEAATDAARLEQGEALARAALFAARSAAEQQRARLAIDRARLWRGEPVETAAWQTRAAWYAWGRAPALPWRQGVHVHAPAGSLARWEWLVDGLEAALWGSDARRIQSRRKQLQAVRGRLPPLLRIRVDWLVGGSAEGARRAGARAVLQSGRKGSAMEVLEHMSALLETCRDADPAVALRETAARTRDVLRARSVAIFAAGRALPVAGHGDGWNQASEIAARCAAAGAAAGPEPGAAGVNAGVAVHAFGGVAGAITTAWPTHAVLDEQRVRLLLHAAALVIAPVLRTWIDRAEAASSAPPAHDMPELVGASAALEAVRRDVRRVARVAFPVLIEGESGVGKELVARAIHRLSPRAARPFRALNCAAMSEELVEAELFGHAQGAFTGAATARAGLFEDADRGTLFLDEVSELSLRAQAKLLRVLQESEVRRVGETAARRIDVRIIAATNRPMRGVVDTGAFRADLSFRLDVLRLEVPPLRQRPEDIALLAAHFWREAAARAGTDATLAPEVIGRLAEYHWPGNVRELQNVVAALAVSAPRRGRVSCADLPAHIRTAQIARVTLHQARMSMELDLVRGALARAGGKPARAAAELGVSRQGLAKLMRRLGLPAA